MNSAHGGGEGNSWRSHHHTPDTAGWLGEHRHYALSPGGHVRANGSVGAVDGRVRPWRMLVVAVAWGSCFLLLGWGVRGGSVLWFVTWRALIAALAVGSFGLINRRHAAAAMPPLSASTWGLIGVLGILNVAVAFAAMAVSVGVVTTGAASVLGNAQALLVVLPAWWLFGERPRLAEIAGVATGFGGLMLIAGSAGGGRGAWLALLAAAAIAAGALLARRLDAVDVVVVGAGQFLIGGVILAVAAGIADGSPLHGLSWRFVVGALALALPGTALPYLLWFTELRRASITAVTSWTLVVPVVGVALGVLVLGESLSPRQVAGTALVVAAMVLVATSGRRHSERLACWQQSGCSLVCERSGDLSPRGESA